MSQANQAMQVYFQIFDKDVSVEKVEREYDGRVSVKYIQIAYLCGLSLFPQKIKLQLDDMNPYGAGMYITQDDFYKSGDFDRPSLDMKVNLIPLVTKS